MTNSMLPALVLAVCAIVFLIVVAIRRARREVAARKWPDTEATVQPAQMEEIGSGRYKVVLPCFAFSYLVNGEYYSGRFSLSAKGEDADSLVKEMPGKKLTVQYDPEKPSSFYIPDEWIENCEVRLIPD